MSLTAWLLGVRSYYFFTYFFMCSCCVYMYLEQDFQVLEQLKMSISRYTYFYIMYLCHSPIYFTLPRGGSSPPIVQLEEMILTSHQYLYIISKSSSFQATLPYQLKNLIKREGQWFSQSRLNCQRNFDMPGKKPRSRYSKKSKGFLCRKKREKSTGGKICQFS